MSNFYNKIIELNKNGQSIAVSVISGPEAGSKAIWSEGGFIYRQGGIKIFEKLGPLLAGMRKSQVISVGDSDAFCEFMSAENYLVVCGAGHVSMPIVKIGKMLGLNTTVIDDRPSFANNARHSGADAVICSPFTEALDSISGGPSNYFVIVTRGHRYDVDCLRKILPKENAYIGMIGSKLRVKAVMELLRGQGIEKGLLERVHAPIGLKINAQTPEEIAVSIMAEIIQVKNQNNCGYGYPCEILDAINSKELSGVPKALVTIISRKGSAPRDVGTKMLVLTDGSCVGTVGGGCMESEICAIARQCARDETPLIHTVNLSLDKAEEDGMVCGGVVEVFVESVR